jgi:hypothetical protein
MKRLLVITICFLFLLVGESFPQIFSGQTDTGDIQEMYGDRIYVRGQGSHIFEIISPCSWCERGATVKITFDSFTRASIRPVPNLLKTAPIQVFIIKDGRQDDQ